MRLRDLTDVAFKYRHVKTGEVIYALPILTHITTHIKTKGSHGRTFLLDMTRFKNSIEECANGSWIYVREREARRFMLFPLKYASVYQTTRTKLITEYDEITT